LTATGQESDVLPEIWAIDPFFCFRLFVVQFCPEQGWEKPWPSAFFALARNLFLPPQRRPVECAA
jgi:hypothetical protein